MLIYVYARKSVYTKEGESIQNQIEICKNYIFSHISGAKDDDIVVYKDEGFSGKDINRPEFKKMLENISKYKANYVVCYKLDRISRSVVDFSNLFQTLTSKRIELVCVKEQFDTSTPMGRAMMNMTAAFAQMERETIAERVRDNMIFLSKTGRWLGGSAPTGFSIDRQEEIILDGKIKISSWLKENQDMKIIRLMYRKMLEIGSLNGVAKYFARNGIKSVNQNYYSHGVTKQCLENPVYCTADEDALNYFKEKGAMICFEKKDCKNNLGIMPFNRKSTISGKHDVSNWIIAIGKHKGIVSGNEWIATQNIIAKNKREPYTYTKYALLSGAITCKNCGKFMLSKLDTRYDKESENDRRFGYYCKNKLSYGVKICDSKNLSGKKTDQKIIDYLMNYNEADLKKNLNIKKFTRKANKFKDKANEIHFEILDLKEKQNKYIEHLLTLEKRSPIIKNVENKVQELDSKIEKLQSQKRIFDAQSELVFDEKSNVDQCIKNLLFFKQNFYTLDFDAKKSLLRLILKKIIWNGSELDIILNGE